MVDREKVLAVLARRFPHAAREDTAAAANAIVGLDDEWEEVKDVDPHAILQQAGRGDPFKVYRRRRTATGMAGN